MQNNFENEVRKRLEEVQMTPSAPVWLNVEHQIRQEKRRRRAILWIFLPLALGLGASAYFLTNHGDAHSPLAQSGLQPKATNTIKTAPVQRELPATIPSQLPYEASDPRSAAIGNLSSGASLTIDTDPVQSHYTTGGQHRTGSNNNQLAAGNNKVAASAPEINNESAEPQTSGSTSATTVVASAETALGKDPDEVAAEAKQNDAPVEKAVNTAALNNPFKPVQMKKWSIGPSLGFGLSKIVDHINEESPVYAANSNVPSIQAAAFSRYAAQASTLQINSYALAAGISVERRLSRKLSVASGIDYRYYASIIEVGEATTTKAATLSSTSDNVKPAYFRTGNTISQYRNSYHFVSIPLDIHFMPFSKVPVDFSAGISYQRLLTSNALIYHYESRLLYANEVEMNKNMFFGRVGFEFRMPSKDHIITVGPELLASLQSVQSRDHQRLVMAGVRARFLFGK